MYDDIELFGLDDITSFCNFLSDLTDDEPDYFPTDYVMTTVDEMKDWVIGSVPYDIAETFWRELKEFVILNEFGLFKESSLTEIDIQRMFQTNSFGKLGEIGKTRLVDMLDHYMPKYFTSFMNTETKKSEFIIGLTDDGQVTGCLVPSSFTESDLNDMVKSRIISIIKSQGFSSDIYAHYVGKIIPQIDVRMVHLPTSESDLSLLDDDESDKCIADQKEKTDKYNFNNACYISGMRTMTKMMRFYRRSIENIINDPEVRPDFVEFIKNYQPTDPKVLKKITIRHRRAMVQKIKKSVSRSKIITFSRGQIPAEKKFPCKMAFWITSFRETMLDYVNSIKPTKPGIKPIDPYIWTMMQNPIRRIVTVTDKDPSLKMIVIQIIFPGQHCIPFPSGQNYHNMFWYIDDAGNKRSTSRLMNGNGPSCL